ncbi:MAG: acyltransferase [Verrucomicrobia bacterium]|nr:acyltransferase [Verrucomicrobiota bacterium]
MARCDQGLGDPVGGLFPLLYLLDQAALPDRRRVFSGGGPTGNVEWSSAFSRRHRQGGGNRDFPVGLSRGRPFCGRQRFRSRPIRRPGRTKGGCFLGKLDREPSRPSLPDVLVCPSGLFGQPVSGAARTVWIDWNFYYLNAAWWYFCLILQLFALFPLLFWALRRFGWLSFFVLATLAGFAARYFMLSIHPVSGQFVLGGCGLSRMPEFAFGMVLGALHAKNAARFESWLLRGPGFLAGLLLYPLALKTYQVPNGYVAVDLLTGIACFLVVAGASGFWASIPRLGGWLALAGSFSYGIYLIHQPYAIHFASFLQGMPAARAIPLLVLIVVGLAFWGGLLEKLLSRWLAEPVAPKPPRP